MATVCVGFGNREIDNLLQRAAYISNIRSSDAAPFRLRAQLHRYGDQPFDANYELIWVSSSRWREEISYTNGHTIRIGGPNTVSTTSDNEQAQRMRWEFRALDVPAVLYTKPSQSLAKLKSHDGRNLQCFSRTAKNTGREQLCIDAGSGVLVREDVAGRTAEYSKYAEFKGKLFPRLITIASDNKIDETIEVQDLADAHNPESTLFDADAKYKTTPGCEHPVTPTPIKLPDPKYPSRLRTSDPQIVKLWGTINQMGQVENLIAVRSAGALDTYAIAAVSKWKFGPATCKGIPVPFQFATEVNFRTDR